MSVDNQHVPNDQSVLDDEEHTTIADEHRVAQQSGEVFESEVPSPIEQYSDEIHRA